MAFGQKCYNTRHKPSIMASSSHGFGPSLTTYGGLHKVVKVMQNFLWKNGNLFYNVHEWNNNPNLLFPKCVHSTLPPEEECSKKWSKSGGIAHIA